MLMRNSFTKKIRSLLEKAGVILIMLFFVTFPFNIRKVFPVKYSFLKGTYNDFLTPSIRISDIIIFLFIIFTIINFICQYYKRSIKGAPFDNKANSSLTILTYFNLNFSRETVFLVVLWLWLALSVLWSPLKEVALYKALCFSEILIFFAMVYHFALNKANLYKHIKMVIIACGTVQSVIAVSQFINNGSLGLKIIGESIIGPNIAGVAKITFFGMKHIRAYGTFTHPNVLAGFLIIPIIMIADLILRRIFYPKNDYKMVSHETAMLLSSTFFLIAILLIQISGFLLTFSRSAYIGLILGIFIYLSKFIKINMPYIKHIIISIVLLVFIVSLFVFVSQLATHSLFSFQSLEERNLYNNVSREIIFAHPFRGVGIGQFVFEEYRLHETFQGWQYQPVHNVYLLISSELGLIGFILYFIIIVSYFLKYFGYNAIIKKTLTWPYICMLITFLSIGFFDHYLWDIEQGLIIFFIPFLLLLLSCHLEPELNN
jgi:hypothetical protein